MSRPTTPNYGIPKYADYGNKDTMTVFDVYGVAMDIIDDIMAQLKALIDALEARMDDAERRITVNEGDIYNLQQDLASFKTEVNNHFTQVEGDITNLENALNNFKTEVNNKFENIEGDINSLEQQLNTYISNNNAELSNVWDAIKNILEKVYGGGSVNENDGSITWGDTGTIAIGNINLTDNGGYIRTHSGTSANDVEVN